MFCQTISNRTIWRRKYKISLHDAHHSFIQVGKIAKRPYFSRIDTANPPHEAIFNFNTVLLVTTFLVMV